ncbi:hypothetical protein BGW80DRAFT_1542047 [Lactifluus volemus]|nr:hypothetical protein BGW80DRAFT_1542047 [Lactifluus volemus]
MSGFAVEVDAAAHDINNEDQQTCAAHKVLIEMYAFLLNWSARSVEKVNVPDEDASAAMHPQNRAYSYADRQGFEVEMSKIWTVSGERDTFIGCLTAPAYHVTENEQYMKSQPIKLGVYKPYPMRMGIIEIIGCLIRELACSEDLTSDAHQMQKQLNGLYDLFLERTSIHRPQPTLRPAHEISQTAPRHHACGGVHAQGQGGGRAQERDLVDRQADGDTSVRIDAWRFARDGGVVTPIWKCGRSGDEFYGSAHEVDSIMDEDEPESRRAEDGGETTSTWSSANCKKLLSTRVAHTQGALTGNTAKKSDDTGDAFELSQPLFVVGHVAVKHIVLELVEREWKRQKQENELAEKLARGTGNDAASKDEEELDQVAGNAEYEIGDRIAAVRETRLLYGPDSLLAMDLYWSHQPKYFGQNTTLRAVATLSFSKFLCVSSQFCDANHYLLFCILETSRDPNIRSNIAIALGDVAVSFSTIVDENSDELYRGLSDKDLSCETLYQP